MFGATEILVVITTILLLLYAWLKYHYAYWKRRNFPFIPPKLIIGNISEIAFLRKNAATAMQELYNHEAAVDAAAVGFYIFHKPALLVREPELIKQILIKDFNKFSNRYAKTDVQSDSVAGYNLFFLKNPVWRNLRNKLTPLFTSGKMKQMFHLFNDIGKKMDEHLNALQLDPATNSKTVEIKDLFALYTTDIIADIAFGVEANCLKNPNCDFRVNGRTIFTFNTRRAIEFASVFFLPQSVRWMKSKLLTKEANEFLRSTTNYVINERRKTGITRNDIMDALMKLYDSNDKSDIDFNEDMLVAQAALFFTGGFETSSSTMALTMLEFTKHPECQKRLREEIKEVLLNNNQDITYEAVQNMEYLNMVLQEVLRLYPLMPFLDRECALYDGSTEYSLEPFFDISIPNGMPIYIPIYAIQRDPKYFTDPDVFNPERFSPENKPNIPPFAYIPFGSGPRNCIGERFALMQVKVGLINFFKNHYVRQPKYQKEMKYDTRAMLIQFEGGIHCDIVRDPLFK